MSSKLIIVESPTKAKTIKKFLGKDYEILSSYGHVRDLPKSKMGIDFDNDFAPTYEIPDKSKKQVAKLRKAAKDADIVYLATDEDREGEAIAWHVASILKLDPEKVKRIAFHEITKSAVVNALEHPRNLDMNLVDAQQARRILDRLVGYKLSPFLWQKVQRGLSAGRVQSVAVRLIVEREREREAFNVEEYWTIDGEFSKDEAVFPAKLNKIDGKKLEKFDIPNEDAAKKIHGELEGAKFKVDEVEKKEVSKAPPKPLTTSALQIEANNKLGYSAKQTMTLAQKLYENGNITYMRTDSMNLAQKFLDEAQAYIGHEFGDKYASGAKQYTTSAKGAQEAHEAIRPTDVAVKRDELPKSLDEQARKLYDLIWRRTLATQMPAARLERTSVDIASGKYSFRASGSTIAFDGFMKVYRSATEKILPDLKKGDAVEAEKIEPTQHFTEPPPRYSDATLVKALEEHGIGRPSTYAPTISTIIARGYVERDENKKLYPYDIANIVNDVLVEHFPNIVDYEFTATMEDTLDNIAEGKIEWKPTIRAFYGPFSQNLEKKNEELKREDIMQERVVGTDPKTGLTVIARNGRFGPFVQLGEWAEEDQKKKINRPKSASLEKGMSLQTITVEQALRLLELPREVGLTDNGEMIIANKGRYGAYLKAGEITASLPEDISPKEVTLEEAKIIIAEATEEKRKKEEPIAELGEDPNSKAQILIKDGRYGPYVTDGTTNASIPKTIDPVTVTLEQAVEMLEKKRKSPKRSWKKSSP